MHRDANEGVRAPVRGTFALLFEDVCAPIRGRSRSKTFALEDVIINAVITIEDIVVGEGETAEAGQKVTVHYTGMFEDGETFDTSVGRGPFSFPLGAGRVIKGWDMGVAGMKVGGKRKLVIPSELGYGSRGAGDVIPPDTTLVFEVELLSVE